MTEQHSIEFWFVRHGETIFNKKNLIQGWSDSPLTKNGIGMTKKMSEFLKDYKFKTIYSSDLNRAIDTANIINNKLCLEVNIEKNFRELNTGIAEGDDINLHLKKYSDTFNLKLYKKVEDGEEWKEVLDRMITGIKKISENINEDNNKVLVVGHSLAIGALISYLNDFSNIYKVKHSDITILEYKNYKLKIKELLSIQD